VSLLISLFGPLGWAHYYLLQLLMLPALLGLAGLRRGTFLIAIIAFATSRPAFHDLREIFPGDLPVMAVGTCAMLLMFIAATARRAQDNSTEPAPVTA